MGSRQAISQWFEDILNDKLPGHGIKAKQHIEFRIKTLKCLMEWSGVEWFWMESKHKYGGHLGWLCEEPQRCRSMEE